MTHTEIVSFIWNVANLIRDSFKRGKYQDVILPLTVLRRLDLRARSDQGEGAGAERRAAGPGLGGPAPTAGAGLRLRLLQHVPLRLPQATGGRAAGCCQPTQLHRGLQLEHAGGGRAVRLRQHDQQARRGGAALPGAGAVPQDRPPPRQGGQPDDGDDLRGAHTALQRGPRREPRRALHAARRGPPHGGTDARGRRGADRWDRGGPHRLRPVLRIGRHADDRQAAHPGGAKGQRKAAPARDQPGGRNPRLRPGGEPRDLGPVEIRTSS